MCFAAQFDLTRGMALKGCTGRIVPNRSVLEAESTAHLPFGNQKRFWRRLARGDITKQNITGQLFF
jgi:hypothetical protein